MTGFFHWFKSSSKMKRWMFLVLVGIMLSCFGMAQIMVLQEVSFKRVGGIVAIFVAGFVCIVIGLVSLNKRTLEVLIENTDDRMADRNNVNVNSLIFNKTIYDKGPNVVVIGGGSGLDTMLSGMKKYTSNLTAIVTVSNYGKEQTDFRKDLQILPTEDIKNSVIALSQNEEQTRRLFNFQYNSMGRLGGLTFADIYFSTMRSISRDFTDAVKKTNEIINMVGKVMPVTLDEMEICAELANGYVVKEKDRIAEVVSDKLTKISRVYLSPTNCRPAPGVLDAIQNADSIIIGPGSLYTDIIPNLLVSGVAKAIKESKAIKVFVSSIMTVPGQTDEYTISDHINAIVEHCGEGLIDYCIYDTGEVVPEYIKKYNREGADLVEQDIDVAKSKFKGIKFLKQNVSVVKDDAVRHDSGMVASSVIELICDDMRYQDKQNDPEYLMMNTKLKADKEINKKKIATEKARKKYKGKEKPKKPRGKSKFSNKYSERIASIRESDELASRRKKMARKKTSGKRASSREERVTRTRARAEEAVSTGSRRKKTSADLKAEMEKTLKNSKLGH